MIGVLVPVGAPDAEAAGAAGRGAGDDVDGGTVAGLAARGMARFGALVRGAGGEFGGAGGALVWPDGRGATMGRAAGPAAGALPGIIGRGGNSIGRPAAGCGVAGAGCGETSGAFGIGALSISGGGSGTTGGIPLGAGVGPLGTRAGSDVSRSAAARAALARWAAIVSSTSEGRAAFVTGAEFEENSSSIDEPAEIVMTPPHTEQRARTVVEGTFVGSTRKIDRHSGQETFTSPPSR